MFWAGMELMLSLGKDATQRMEISLSCVLILGNSLVYEMR